MAKIKTFKAWAATGPTAGSVAQQWRISGGQVIFDQAAEFTIYPTRSAARRFKPKPSKIVRVKITQTR